MGRSCVAAIWKSTASAGGAERNRGCVSARSQQETGANDEERAADLPTGWLLTKDGDCEQVGQHDPQSGECGEGSRSMERVCAGRLRVSLGRPPALRAEGPKGLPRRSAPLLRVWPRRPARCGSNPARRRCITPRGLRMGSEPGAQIHPREEQLGEKHPRESPVHTGSFPRSILPSTFLRCTPTIFGATVTNWSIGWPTTCEMWESFR